MPTIKIVSRHDSARVLFEFEATAELQPEQTEAVTS